MARLKVILFITVCLVMITPLRSLETDPLISEIFIKPYPKENFNEEYIEIMLPTPSTPLSFIYQFGLLVVDDKEILDFIDLVDIDTDVGTDDYVDNQKLVVISNNLATANIQIYKPELMLRPQLMQTLMLIRKPSATNDIALLHLSKVKSFYRLSKPAPLTAVNINLIKNIAVDFVVYRQEYSNHETLSWIQNIFPTYGGNVLKLPIGFDNTLDKVSLARCNNIKFSGSSFKYDNPSPGVKNLCVNVGTFPDLATIPSGVSILQNSINQVPPLVTRKYRIELETAPEIAREKFLVQNWLPQLQQHKMLSRKAEQFFTTSPYRIYYSFIPNMENFTKSAIRCQLCYHTRLSENTDAVLDRIGNQVPSIMRESGQIFRLVPAATWQQIETHQNFTFHKQSVQSFVLRFRNGVEARDIYEEIAPRSDLQVTADKLALVYLEVKVGLSLKGHETLSEGLHDLGFPVGQHLNGKKAAHDIIEFLGGKIHENLIKRLISNDVEFSLMLDSSTDVGLVHTMLIYIRYIEDNLPVTKVLQLTEAHDSTAEGMWKVLKKSFIDEGPPFVAYVKRRACSLATDGASNMMGNYNSLKIKLAEYVVSGERENRSFQHYHCANHRLALAYNDVMYSSNSELSFCKKLTDHCNDLARFYSSKSYKRRDEMLNQSRSLNERIRSFQRIQKVRWVPAVQDSYYVIIQNYKTFMHHLHTMTTRGNDQYPTEARTTARKIYTVFSDKKLIATLHLHLDIIQELSKWAKWLERRESTIIDIEGWYTNVKNMLKTMKQSSGPYLEDFLKTCLCGTTPCNTLQTYEATANVVWKGITLSNQASSGIPALSSTRAVLLDSLLETFDKRFPPEAVSAFSVLLPTVLHLSKDSQWNNFATYLNQYHGFDTNSIASELIHLKNRIVQSSFFENYQDDPPEIFWSNALSNDDFGWTERLKKVIRIALVQPSSTAQVESGFSQVASIKTKHRSRTSTPIVQATLRLKFNGPSVKYLPKYRLALDWINKQHSKADATKLQRVDKNKRRSEFIQTMRF